MNGWPIFNPSFVIIHAFSGNSAIDCTSEFPLLLSSEEDLDSNFTQLLDDYANGALYVFPELKFQCETDIKRIRGYFLVDPDESTSFYFQIWRKQNTSGEYIRIEEVNLNFSALCENDNNDEPCYIDYAILRELEVKVDDFIGFYTENNTLARPLFSSSETSTHLYLFTSRFNIPVLRETVIKRLRIPLRSIFYRPQVASKFNKHLMLILYCNFWVSVDQQAVAIH